VDEEKDHMEEVKGGRGYPGISCIHVAARAPDRDAREGEEGRLQQIADLYQLRGADPAPAGGEDGLLDHVDQKSGISNEAEEGVVGLGGQKAVDIREGNGVAESIRAPERGAEEDVFTRALELHEMRSNGRVGGKGVRVNPETIATIGGVTGREYPAVQPRSNKSQAVECRSAGGHKGKGRRAAHKVGTGRLTGGQERQNAVSEDGTLVSTQLLDVETKGGGKEGIPGSPGGIQVERHGHELLGNRHGIVKRCGLGV
jgi:hypothetical protein